MKRFIQFCAVIVLGIIAVVFIRTGSFHFLTQIKNYTQSADKQQIVQDGINNITNAIKKEISNPVPLVWNKNSAQAYLTHDGVIAWTNTQRKDTSGLPPLADNATLDKIAEERLADMFAKQYFEHISPDGIGATNLAKDAGYDYISIGENIALGNFDNDQVLVQAWMDSPGHRANILNTKFTEIGVAVASGMYEGKKTWIGVQVFGKPNTCTYADETLKTKIENTTNVLNDGKIKIAKMSGELEAMKNDSSVDRDVYNAKVEEYNTLAHELNSLSATIKNIVSQYNAQVVRFNACIQG